MGRHDPAHRLSAAAAAPESPEVTDVIAAIESVIDDNDLDEDTSTEAFVLIRSREILRGVHSDYASIQTAEHACAAIGLIHHAKQAFNALETHTFNAKPELPQDRIDIAAPPETGPAWPPTTTRSTNRSPAPAAAPRLHHQTNRRAAPTMRPLPSPRINTNALQARRPTCPNPKSPTSKR